MYSFSSYSPKINCLLLLNISGSDLTNNVSWSRSKGNNMNNVKMLKIKNTRKTIITENFRTKLLIFIRYCTNPSNIYARTMATKIGAIV